MPFFVQMETSTVNYIAVDVATGLFVRSCDPVARLPSPILAALSTESCLKIVKSIDKLANKVEWNPRNPRPCRSFKLPHRFKSKLGGSIW